MGQRVDSCIKDVASIIHQMGYTPQAIEFLEEMQHHYRGDTRAFRNLQKTLENQLNPSLKHYVTSIALELPYPTAQPWELI